MTARGPSMLSTSATRRPGLVQELAKLPVAEPPIPQRGRVLVGGWGPTRRQSCGARIGSLKRAAECPASIAAAPPSKGYHLEQAGYCLARPDDHGQLRPGHGPDQPTPRKHLSTIPLSTQRATSAGTADPSVNPARRGRCLLAEPQARVNPPRSARRCTHRGEPRVRRLRNGARKIPARAPPEPVVQDLRRPGCSAGNGRRRPPICSPLLAATTRPPATPRPMLPPPAAAPPHQAIGRPAPAAGGRAAS